MFKTINSVLHAPQSDCLENSSEVFSTNKNACIRAHFHPPSVAFTHTADFDQFELVSLSLLEEIIDYMKPVGSPNEIIPLRLFKEVFPTIAHTHLGFLMAV